MTQNQGSISNIERQEQILDFIQAKKRATVAQICEKYKISEATARRDLENLACSNKIQRVHGGAILIRRLPQEPPIINRVTEQTEEKKRIGLAAAQLIEDNDTVFLGSGTTVLEVARNLGGRKKLNVITNSLLVINTLMDMPEITIIALGGLFRREEMSMIGYITEQALSQVRADKVIIGVRAIDVDQGLTNQYLQETQTDRAILGIARQTIVVADHTKCGMVSTAFLAPINKVDILITDKKAPDDFIGRLKGMNIKVIQA